MNVAVALDDVSLPTGKVGEYVAVGNSENGVTEFVRDVLMAFCVGKGNIRGRRHGTAFRLYKSRDRVCALTRQISRTCRVES